MNSENGNWKTVRLGDVCEQISGEWGQDCSDGNGTKVLRTTNFTNIGILKYDDVVERLIPQNKIDTKQLKKGDIILEKSGGSDTQPVGRVVYFDRDDDVFLCNNFTTALRISDDSVFSKYVFDYMFYMHKIGITEYYQNKTTGIRNLQTKAYLDRKIPLPPLATQKHIAAVLDKCTEVIKKHKLMLEKYDTLIKSQFIEMFGDPVQNPMGWEVKSLGEYIETANNGLARRGNDKDGKIVLRLVELQRGKIDYSNVNRISIKESEEKYLLKENDILFARVNGNPENVGRCAFYKNIGEQVYHNDHIIRIHFFENKLNEYFLNTLLNSDYGKSEFKKYIKTSAGQYTIAQEGIASAKIPVPHLALQQKFAQFVQAVAAQKAKAQKSLEKAEILYKALMQQYFA